MKKISVVALIFFLAGCMSSPSKQYFEIFLPETQEVSALRFDKILYIESAEVKDLYNDFRIIYRESPYQLNYYSYDFWADRPGKLVRQSIISYFKKNRVFRNVIRVLAKDDPDLVMRIRINAIEEDDRAPTWYARLAMEIQISDHRSGDILVTHEFDQRKKLRENLVAQLPAAVSQILEEELLIVLRELSSKLNDLNY